MISLRKEEVQIEVHPFLAFEDGHCFLSRQELDDYRTELANATWNQG